MKTVIEDTNMKAMKEGFQNHLGKIKMMFNMNPLIKVTKDVKELLVTSSMKDFSIERLSENIVNKSAEDVKKNTSKTLVKNFFNEKNLLEVKHIVKSYGIKFDENMPISDLLQAIADQEQIINFMASVGNKTIKQPREPLNLEESEAIENMANFANSKRRTLNMRGDK